MPLMRAGTRRSAKGVPAEVGSGAEAAVRLPVVPASGDPADRGSADAGTAGSATSDSRQADARLAIAGPVDGESASAGFVYPRVTPSSRRKLSRPASVASTG